MDAREARRRAPRQVADERQDGCKKQKPAKTKGDSMSPTNARQAPVTGPRSSSSLQTVLLQLQLVHLFRKCCLGCEGEMPHGQDSDFLQANPIRAERAKEGEERGRGMGEGEEGREMEG